ncbi:hypothetical protein R1flu_016395 [Riccia fluitans]|uniref:Uncharacterized protein n=1 Tax=Riccia fluitans TaxID=41844 RepID=A0ABD1YMS0_9MARC
MEVPGQHIREQSPEEPDGPVRESSPDNVTIHHEDSSSEEEEDDVVAVSPIVPRVIVLPIVGETSLASLVRSATPAVVRAKSEDLFEVDNESTPPKKHKVIKVYGRRELPLRPRNLQEAPAKIHSSLDGLEQDIK